MKKYLHSLYSQAHRQNELNILKLVGIHPGARLLDLGCDDGTWTKQLAGSCQAKETHGLEVVAERAALASSKGVEAKIGDLNREWPYADASFDIIHSNFVIEHIDDIDFHLKESFRVLRPGGFTVVATENGSSWHNVFAAIMGWQTFSSSCCSVKLKGLGNPLALHRGEVDPSPGQRHKFIFNYLGFIEIYKAYGFESIKILGAGYHPLPSKFGSWDPRHSHFISLRAIKPPIDHH